MKARAGITVGMDRRQAEQRARETSRYPYPDGHLVARCARDLAEIHPMAPDYFRWPGLVAG